MVRQHARHPGGVEPCIDLVPARVVVVQHAGHLVERHARAQQYIGDLRDGTRGAVGEPLARHRRAIASPVERRIIDRTFRLQIQEHDRDLRALQDGQNRRRHGVGRDVQEDDVDVRASEGVAGREGLVHGIDQAEVRDRDVRTAQSSLDPSELLLEPSLEPGELRPVRVEPDPEQPDAQLVHSRQGSIARRLARVHLHAVSLNACGPADNGVRAARIA